MSRRPAALRQCASATSFQAWRLLRCCGLVRSLPRKADRQKEGETMATIVLVHGAYQGGWIWARVAPILRAAGHTVFAPSLDGCAERKHALRPGITTESHAAEIAELLFFEDLHDVVLVGTSS